MERSLILILFFLSLVLSVKLACVGTNFTCYVLDSGETKCFGNNTFSQLGRANNNATIPPNTLASSYNPTMMVCGHSHVLVMASSGLVYGWGNSGSGQVGVGTNGVVSTPTSVTIPSCIGIYTGSTSSCMCDVSQNCKCWGNNNVGQLGYGNTVSLNIPNSYLSISSGNKVMAMGYLHTCVVVTTTKNAYCWGNNGNGQLGINSTQNKGGVAGDIPYAITLSNVVAMALGDAQSCWLFVNGSFACAGNGYGLLPQLDGSGKTFVSLAAVGNATYGLDGSGNLWGWSNLSPNPVSITAFAGLSNLTFISGVTSSQLCLLGLNSSYSLTSKKLYCWDQISNNGVLISTSCGDSIVQTVEGEQCDPPSSTCGSDCRWIVTSSPTPPPAPPPTTIPAPSSAPSPSSSLPSSSGMGTSSMITPPPSITLAVILPPTIINTTNSILVPTTVVGNFTLTETATLVIGNNTLINVQGCANLAGNLTVNSVSNNAFLTADCVNGTFSFVSASNNGGENNCLTTRQGNDNGRVAMFVQSGCTKGFPYWIIGVVVGGVVVGGVAILAYSLNRVRNYHRYSTAFHRMDDNGSL